MDEVKETVVAVMPTVPVSKEGEEYEAEGASLLNNASDTVITTEEQYSKAAELASEIKRRSAAVTDFFKPLKDAAHKAHKSICDREKEVLKPFIDAEKAVKRAMAGYLEEVERQKRQYEEYLRAEAQKQVNKSIEKAAELEAQGKSDEAEKVLNNAVIAESFQNTSMAVDTPAPKAKKASVTKGYEITSIDEKIVPAEIAGVCIRPVDDKAVMRLIKASKGKIQIPGITYKEVNNISIRR